MGAIWKPPRNEDYSATKAAVVAVTNGVAVEFARYGVRANSILPGWIATDMTGAAQRERRVQQTSHWPRAYRRWGKPEELGGHRRLSPATPRVYNGDSLVVDGGYGKFSANVVVADCRPSASSLREAVSTSRLVKRSARLARSLSSKNTARRLKRMHYAPRASSAWIDVACFKRARCRASSPLSTALRCAWPMCCMRKAARPGAAEGPVISHRACSVGLAGKASDGMSSSESPETASCVVPPFRHRHRDR